MKKIILLLLAVVLLLTGCDFLQNITEDRVEPTETEESTTEPEVEITEPTEPWIYEIGIPWDTEGALLEIPLSVPDGMHYTASVALDGDLLLWSYDYHIADTTVVELCVIDLDVGDVIAQRDVPMPPTPTVQVQGDSVYLIHAETGYIEQLNKELKTVRVWNTEPLYGNWYVGGENLYIYDWDSGVAVRDLTTGETKPLLDGNPGISYFLCRGDVAMIDYYRPDTGALAVAALDLISGEVFYPPVQNSYTLATYQDGIWLCGEYAGDVNVYTFSTESTEPVIIAPGGGMLQLIDGKYLLYSSMEDTFLRLHDLQGNCLAECDLSAEPYSYSILDCIWSDTFGGYFCPINGYDGNQRLLFWDISQGRDGEDLIFQPIPEESEENALLKQRARELGEKYGLTILVSDDCDTVFDEFTAQIASDYWEVSSALDTLDTALSAYPEGFFHQLRYGSVYGIQIQLVTDLMADGSGRYGDGYSAFAQENWDHYLVVMDIEDTYTQTYYHEISHIIDSYLEWDSWNREGALYSWETWNSMNPSWFSGYSYDYSDELYLEDYSAFVDSYSTISPTEDRARVMEYAMADGCEFVFEDADILLAKLAYYARCIRDAFDTEGWPEMLPWEQYLR